MPTIEVAIGALIDPLGRIFVAQRALDDSLGGLWEFPGGKLEVGETASAALVRELKEEIGVTPISFRKIDTVHVTYDKVHITLHCFEVFSWESEPFGREGQPVQWVSLSQLAGMSIPAGSKPLLKKLNLPRSIAISPPQLKTIESISQWAVATEKRVQPKSKNKLALLLRADITAVTHSKIWVLLEKLKQQNTNPFCSFLIHSRHVIGSEMGANEPRETYGFAGIHYSYHSFAAATNWYDATADWQTPSVGVSCHNALELVSVEAKGANYVFLSPVNQTPSHPDQTPMGWTEFAHLTKTVSLPVYALGGVTQSDLDRALSVGAFGVAYIRDGV